MRTQLFSFKGREDAAESASRMGCTGRKARGVLTVECKGCRRPQDLSDPDCLKGVLRLLTTDPSGVREVVLSRDWEIAYDDQCTLIMGRLAEVMRFCNGLSFQQPFDDCPACRSNPRSVVSRVVEALPRPAPELGEEHRLLPGDHGRACDQCTRALRSNLDHARSLLTLAERQVNKVAYRVVEDHEH